MGKVTVKIRVQNWEDIALLDLPNIIGHIPLEGMDWVVDMTGQKLIGNPAHGGELLHEEF